MWDKKSSGNGSTVTTSSTNGHLNVNGTDITIYDDTTLKNQAHTHTNKSLLDNLSDSSGTLAYKGVVIAASGSSSTDPLYPGLLTSQQTFNLYDKTRLTSGTHHDTSTGNVVTGSYETHSITVKAGYNYSFNRGDTIGMGYTFFDSTGTFISGGTATKAKAPTNATTMYVVIPNSAISDNLMVMESNYFFADYVPYTQRLINPTGVQGWYQSKWYNKTWWVLGDSISTGWGDGAAAGNQFATKPYHYTIARSRHIKVQNDAVSGYTISQIYNNKVVSMPSTANAPDLITLMAGTNDHGFNTAMGTINDATTTSTFYGTYKKTVEYLRSQYPLATIGLITPIQRYNSGGTDGNVANAAGYTLRQYCDAVVAIANYYSLPYLDWYGNLGFTPYNTNDYTNFFCSDGGTHPNDSGHVRMAARVGDFIERI